MSRSQGLAQRASQPLRQTRAGSSQQTWQSRAAANLQSRLDLHRRSFSRYGTEAADLVRRHVHLSCPILVYCHPGFESLSKATFTPKSWLFRPVDLKKQASACTIVAAVKTYEQSSRGFGLVACWACLGAGHCDSL